MAFGVTAHVHLAVHGRAGIAGGVTDALFGHEIAHIWECAIVPGVRCGEREQEEGTVDHRPRVVDALVLSRDERGVAATIAKGSVRSQGCPSRKHCSSL